MMKTLSQLNLPQGTELVSLEKNIQLDSLPGRRGCTSRAAPKCQAWAIGTIIVTTSRNEELDLASDSRITDRFYGIAAVGETHIRPHVEVLRFNCASAVRSGKCNNCGWHYQRGGNEERSAEEDSVELHGSEMA